MSPTYSSAREAAPRGRAPRIPFQKFVLENGLEVILHEDHAEPVVAVCVYYHVGSGREVSGKSGFAHLFEHMLFQGSEHVAGDGHFRLVQAAGGTVNGNTTQDRTFYYETLPSSHLELALWLESDRMGFLLPAMTQEKLDNQRDVVKNERRQSYENRPYGLVHETLCAALYPPGHPYSWPTIGSMADIEAATLEDVAEFFRRYYGPGNATLALGGDFEPEAALALVRRWFGALPGRLPVERPVREPAALARSRRVVLEDKVTLPQLTIAWPTVESGHPDEAPLALLGDVLSANKSALFDRVLEIDEKLASLVTLGHVAQERAGYLVLNLRPNPGVALGTLETRVEELLAQLVVEGITAEVLERLRNRHEGALFRSLETVIERTSWLGHANLFHGDPDRLTTELERLRAVTPDDVLRVARAYLLGRPRVVLSVVPTGRRELAAAERPLESAPFVEDAPRAVPPASPAARPFHSPPVWKSRLANGARVLGTPFANVPLARLSLAVPAGRLREERAQLGLASLAAEMLKEGTRSLDPVAFTERVDSLGAEFQAFADDDEIALRMTVLAEHLAEAAALVSELVLEPRFARADFERLQRQRLLRIDTRGDRIRTLADDAFARLLWSSTGSVRAEPDAGTRATIERVTVEDVQAFWSTLALARSARLSFVGAAGADELVRCFGPLAERWSSANAVDPLRIAAGAAEPGLYLVDKPGAAQSELRIGHAGVATLDPDFYPLQALNQILGGSFSSRLNANLREDKGYTYGIRSGFEGGLSPGAFVVDCAVHTPVTAPAVAEVLAELARLREGVRADEVDFARRALGLSLQRNLESSRSRLNVLEAIGRYGHPDDYLERRLAWLATMTTDDLDALARRHVRPSELAVLVVGDREAIRGPLAQLGLGEVVELDAYGRPR